MVEVVIITCHFSDLSAKDFIEPLPTIEFVAQLLNSEIYSTPLRCRTGEGVLTDVTFS